MNRHGPTKKGTPIMNRVPGPRTPQSNVESGVQDDQEWPSTLEYGGMGGSQAKEKLVISAGYLSTEKGVGS